MYKIFLFAFTYLLTKSLFCPRVESLPKQETRDCASCQQVQECVHTKCYFRELGEDCPLTGILWFFPVKGNLSQESGLRIDSIKWDRRCLCSTHEKFIKTQRWTITNLSGDPRFSSFIKDDSKCSYIGCCNKDLSCAIVTVVLKQDPKTQRSICVFLCQEHRDLGYSKSRSAEPAA